MSIYSLTQYIKYRLKAKTRHGVHSPFVYGFIEKVLHQKGNSDNIPLSVKEDASLLQNKYRCLLTSIDNYCEPSAIHIALITNVTKLAEQIPHLNSNAVVVVTAIYSSPANAAAWIQLHSDAHVKLSIDIYGAGLLFFKKEFKEKQHFVLKY